MNTNVNLSFSTRTLRNQFRMAVGTKTYNVVRDTLLGFDSHVVARRNHMGVRRVAAVKANLTRGTYWPFAARDQHGNPDGLCAFGG